MRFAVRLPGIPEASPRSHGVPRRDVPGRVHISMAGVSAGRAREARLALARLRIYVPARRAPLTRKRGTDLLHPAGRLIAQAMHQQAPARPQDLPIQPGLGANIPTRTDRAAPGRARHVPDLQVLHPDQVEPTREVRRSLLRPVLAPVRLAGPQPGHRQLDPGAAVGAAPGAGELALQSPQPLLLPPGQAGNVQQLSRRQGRRHRHAPVNAHYLPVTRRRNRLGDHGECDMPAARPIQRHPVGLDARRHGAGPAEPHPPSLRHPYLACPPAQPPHMPGLDGDHPEPLIPLGLAPGRPPGRVGRVEERGHRPGEVPQRLLLHHLAARSQPRVLRPRPGELPTLLQVARGALAAGAPVRVLLHGQVPHVPGMAQWSRSTACWAGVGISR